MPRVSSWRRHIDQIRAMLGSKVRRVFTPAFTRGHTSTIELFRKAAAKLGDKCLVRELDTADNAHALGTAAMVVDSLVTFGNFVRKLVLVQRERDDGGSFRSKS